MEIEKYKDEIGINREYGGITLLRNVEKNLYYTM
jgi:hypothetical protein